MTTFNEALAEHGSAEEAIRHTLQNVFESAIGDMYASFGPVAQWVLDNAAEISQYLKIAQDFRTDPHNYTLRLRSLETETANQWKRIEALEDAPGPRPNAAEVSALRQRMDALTETLEKMRSLDTSDVLAALVRDVALLKDYIMYSHYPGVEIEDSRDFRRTYIGTEPQTPEARKLLGLDVATPEPTPDFNWVETACYVDGELWGQAGKTLDQWVGVVKGACQMFDTKTEARAWVEAQFNQQKP